MTKQGRRSNVLLKGAANPGIVGKHLLFPVRGRFPLHNVDPGTSRWIKSRGEVIPNMIRIAACSLVKADSDTPSFGC